MILVTGASGGVGKYVAQEVARAGTGYRLMYRSPKDASAGPPDKTVIADFGNKPSLQKALTGVESVYVVCSPIPQLVEFENNVIEVAKEKGVRHVVLNSALGAGDYGKSFPALHAKVENNLKGSGLSYTILQPNSFHQNVVAYFAPTIRAQGAFYGAAGDAKFSYLDARDIAVVAAKALAGRDHAGKTYELNGPEALTHTQLAEKISRLTGKPAKYVNLPFDAIRKAMLDQGMPEWQANALVELQEYYAGGKGGATDGVLKSLIGRAPITMDQYLAENKAEFQAQAARA